MKQKVFDNVKKKHVREAKLEELNKRMEDIFNRKPNDIMEDKKQPGKEKTVTKPTVKPLADSFNAKEFINQLERTFGGHYNINGYISHEQNSLFNSKRDMHDRSMRSIKYNAVSSHFGGCSTYSDGGNVNI